MMGLLCEGLKIDEVVLKERAEVLLGDILHNYSDFAISTIDNFVHRIVRVFANDLQLPINFGVETNEEDYIREAIHRLLDDFGEDKILTEFIREFSKFSVENDKPWNPENNIFEYLKSFFKERNEPVAKIIARFDLNEFNEIRKKMASVQAKHKGRIKELGKRGMALLKQANIETDDLFGKSHGIGSLFEKCIHFKIEKNFNSKIKKSLETDIWLSENSKAKIESFNKVKAEVRAIVLEIEKFCEGFDFIQFNDRIVNNLFSLALLNSVNKTINEIKAEKNFIFIKEFNQRIAKIVFSEPIPFLYERLGEKYKNYLLDEFQDTSYLQWNNILPLIENALSEGENCLIVGDGKQSIYRWRGAEVDQFANLPSVKGSENNDILKSRELSLSRNYLPKNLASNFRSKTEVVNFNNDFFEFTANRNLSSELKIVYNDLRQNSNKENVGGFIQINIFHKLKGKKSDAASDEANDSDETAETDGELQKFECVVKKINDCLRDGFSYKDISILMRKNRTGSKLAMFLEKKGLPVISNESLLLSASTEIQIVLNVLTYLLNNDDHVAAISLLKNISVINNFPSEKVIDWLKEFSNNPSVGQLQRMVELYYPEFNIDNYSGQSLFDLCVAIIRDLNLLHRNSLYCSFFLEEVQHFIQKHETDLYSFLDWWRIQEQKASVIIPDSTNAISVLTIHSSKGLEFPVVILPELDWKININEAIWVDLHKEKHCGLDGILLPGNTKSPEEYAHVFSKEKGLIVLDDLNLIYVAFTRAVNRLYLISKYYTQSNPSQWLRDFFEKNLNTLKEGWNILSIGKESFYKGSGKEVVESTGIFKPELMPWYTRIKVKLEGNENWEKDKLSPKVKGSLIHEVLANCNNLNSALEYTSHLKDNARLGDFETKEMKKHLVDFFQHNEFQFLFDDSYRLYNEREIIDRNGNVYRPDRIMMKGNSLILVDFKTGEKRNAHTKQMKDYQSVLSAAGFIVERSVLIYTDAMQSVDI
jgi:ATP-dependent exoDNAse (exonuclease V) beta subunit